MSCAQIKILVIYTLMSHSSSFNTLAGNTAPDFRLQDQEGNWRTLSDFTSHSDLILVFIPEILPLFAPSSFVLIKINMKTLLSMDLKSLALVQTRSILTKNFVANINLNSHFCRIQRKPYSKSTE
jgi:hypothetical protein